MSRWRSVRSGDVVGFPWAGRLRKQFRDFEWLGRCCRRDHCVSMLRCASGLPAKLTDPQPPPPSSEEKASRPSALGVPEAKSREAGGAAGGVEKK